MSPRSPIVVILDIGATNVRCVAVSATGEILGQKSLPNETSPDPGHPGGRIWDLDLLWTKLAANCRDLLTSLPSSPEIAAVTVTTFGVDGAPVDSAGRLLYPVISWACERSVPVMEELVRTGFAKRAYALNGLQPMHYNTVSKILWLKQNRPELFAKTAAWVLMPSLIAQKLCGEIATDTAMAGTTMLTDAGTRSFSSALLAELGLPADLFPRLTEPGSRIGALLKEAALETGIPPNTPVIAAGHDTQFAVFGAGATADTPVLSSGTWEILFARSRSYPATDEALNQGLTSEFDPIPGFFQTGVQWIASGAVEWLKNSFYSAEKSQENVYDLIVREAEASGPDANGVFVHPAFFSGVGPSAPYKTKGSILGLSLGSTRGDISRALFEALAFQTEQALAILQNTCGFRAKALICSGGGARNPLWNRLRADITGLPLLIPERTESTALGAAVFAFTGAGIYQDADTARKVLAGPFRRIEPSCGQYAYKKGRERFLKLAPGLMPLYS